MFITEAAWLKFSVSYRLVTRKMLKSSCVRWRWWTNVYTKLRSLTARSALSFRPLLRVQINKFCLRGCLRHKVILCPRLHPRAIRLPSLGSRDNLTLCKLSISIYIFSQIHPAVKETSNKNNIQINFHVYNTSRNTLSKSGFYAI